MAPVVVSFVADVDRESSIQLVVEGVYRIAYYTVLVVKYCGASAAAQPHPFFARGPEAVIATSSPA